MIHQIIGGIAGTPWARCGSTEGGFSGWNSRVTCDDCLHGEPTWAEFGAAEKEANKKKRR